MKIVTRNERAPRRYSVFRSVSLLDDAGQVWATISLRDGGISISRLEGVKVTEHQLNGMGDYDLDHEFNRSFWSSWCPECKGKAIRTPQKIFDPRTGLVTCKECGHTWAPKGDGVDD